MVAEDVALLLERHTQICEPRHKTHVVAVDLKPIRCCQVTTSSKLHNFSFQLVFSSPSEAVCNTRVAADL